MKVLSEKIVNDVLKDSELKAYKEFYEAYEAYKYAFDVSPSARFDDKVAADERYRAARMAVKKLRGEV